MHVYMCNLTSVVVKTFFEKLETMTKILMSRSRDRDLGTCSSICI